MKLSFFEKLIVKKIKSSKNKSFVELCINKEADLFNCFSMFGNSFTNNTKINDKIMDYIEAETRSIDIRDALIISVKIVDEIKYDLNFIEKLIKEYAERKILMLNKKIHKLNIHSFILAFIGMMLIGITHILRILEKRYSINEFIIVMSWVFMWKAVDLMVFDKTGILKEKGVLMKIYYSEIFIDKTL